MEQDENGKIKILINLSNNNNKNKPNEIISLGSKEIENETETIKTKFDDPKTPTSKGNLIQKKPSSKLKENKELKGFYPEYICAQLLKNIKKNAQNYCDELIKKAVITVPADFSNDQRECTKKAGELAGLDVI